jgi:hypothetical protein
MEPTATSHVWSIEMHLEETADETQAEVVVVLDGERIGGWGRARRNPADPSVPRIGEEVALARAMSGLSHRLLDRAARTIEDFEGHPVKVHP